MPKDPSVAWIDGRLVPWSEAVVPIEDRGLQFSESLYELLPVTCGRPRLVAAHLERMRAGVAALELGPCVPEPEALRQLAASLLEREGITEGLLYLQVTGGTSPRQHVPRTPPAVRRIAYVREHRFPRDRDLDRGLRVVTVPDPRWAQSDVKTTMLLPAVLARREAHRRGADEAIFVTPAGEVREGATSNVFVVAGSRLRTPPASAHLLPGTMRSLVLDAAAAAGFPVDAGPLEVAALSAAEEVFITATSRLAEPVLSVDGRPVGEGRTGPVVREVARWLRSRLGLVG